MARSIDRVWIVIREDGKRKVGYKKWEHRDSPEATIVTPEPIIVGASNGFTVLHFRPKVEDAVEMKRPSKRARSTLTLLGDGTLEARARTVSVDNELCFEFLFYHDEKPLHYPVRKALDI